MAQIKERHLAFITAILAGTAVLSVIFTIVACVDASSRGQFTPVILLLLFIPVLLIATIVWLWFER